MITSPFYNGAVKKIITAFGNLFSGIAIQRHDNAGAMIQSINVPIAYANKEKAIQRVDSDPTLEKQVKISLPRMAFSVTGYEYDPSRKLARMGRIVCNDAINPTRQQVYTAAPWNLKIQMVIVTKTMEDGLQIIEQILPYFQPEFTLRLELLPAMNIQHDVPVVLNSSSVEDTYQGDYTESRLVIHTLEFTIKTQMYGPSVSVGVIKHVTVNVDAMTGDGQFATYHADGDTPVDPITESWTEYF